MPQSKMEEPRVLYCTIRDALDEFDEHELHLECRFSDGQKFPAIIIDGDFENLAREVCDFLNSAAYKNMRHNNALERDAQSGAR